jgi:urease accessory protein
VAASDWLGKLKLVFSESNGKTQPILCQAQAPFKVQRSFYPAGLGGCQTTILHTAGGVVGGDRLEIEIHALPHTRVLLTTAAASKIYGSCGQSSFFSQGQQAEQTVGIRADADSALEWLPQETIVFDGAIFRQRLRVELDPRACWLGWDITRFGRTARGEKFLTGEWRSQTEIWRQGQPLWIDRQRLEGGSPLLDSPYGLAGHPVIATLIWIGQPTPPELIAAARACWTMCDRQAEAGVTTLESGLLCRYRGGSSAEAQDWFVQIWQLLRQFYGQHPVVMPRVWPIQPGWLRRNL